MYLRVWDVQLTLGRSSERTSRPWGEGVSSFRDQVYLLVGCGKWGVSGTGDGICGVDELPRTSAGSHGRRCSCIPKVEGFDGNETKDAHDCHRCT